MLVILTALVFQAAGQTDSGAVRVHGCRKAVLAGGSVALAGGSLVYLHQVWYKPYATGRFHFFNDNAEWLQMDKMGHTFTAYQTGRLMMDAFRWAGCSEKTTLYVGGTMGLVYLSAIETLDGFSRGWGFSWGDMAANTFGSALAVTQAAFLKRQAVQIKFSYFNSGLTHHNPALLGENAATRVIKDYNGQVYWFSFHPFRRNGDSGRRFPAWLNVVVGYGATGMTGGHYNTVTAADSHGHPVQLDRERLVYLSLDADLTRIPCRSKFLRAVFSAVNVLKVPFPAVAVGKNGARGYLLR